MWSPVENYTISRSDVMAYDCNNPNNGDIVYRAFEPKRPGKITAHQLVPRDKIASTYWNVLNMTIDQRDAEWERLRRSKGIITLVDGKGKTFEGIADEFKDFEQLVVDTETKASKHRLRLEAVRIQP